MKPPSRQRPLARSFVLLVFSTVWIRNTLNLERIGVSERLAREATSLQGWRLRPEALSLEFDLSGNVDSPL